MTRTPDAFVNLYNAQVTCSDCTWTSRMSNRACRKHATAFLDLAGQLCPNCGHARPASPRRHCVRCDWLICRCGKYYRVPHFTSTR